MALEHDPEEIVGLPLVPVGRRPDADDARQPRRPRLPRQVGLDAEAVAVAHGMEMVGHRQSVAVVDARKTHEARELKLGVVAEEGPDFHDLCRVHDRGGIGPIGAHLAHGGAEARLETSRNLGRRHR
jgi:hypothetical protein